MLVHGYDVLGAASDDQFIATLRGAGIQIYDPQSAIKTARNVCAQLARGLGYHADLANIGNPATITGAQATTFVEKQMLLTLDLDGNSAQFSTARVRNGACEHHHRFYECPQT